MKTSAEKTAAKQTKKSASTIGHITYRQRGCHVIAKAAVFGRHFVVSDVKMPSCAIAKMVVDKMTTRKVVAQRTKAA